MSYYTHQQQCQGHSWQSGRVLYPDGGQPSWGQSVRCLWGPEEPSGTCGSLSRWCQSSRDKRHRCQAHCLGQSHPCKHLHVHHLKRIHTQQSWVQFLFFRIGRRNPHKCSACDQFHSPSESNWSGLKASLQLSLSSGMPSLSSSWSQASPLPSLSWSAWLALGMYGQLSRLFWWPSSSMSWLLSHLSPTRSSSEST